jgi:hypothetical protein
VVRSDVQRKTPHKHWAQLTAAIKAAIIDFDQTAAVAEWAKVVLLGVRSQPLWVTFSA